MAVKLEKILSGIRVVNLSGNTDLLIENVNIDSRGLSRDSLFIAAKGTVNDGHDFIDEAIKNGAIAIVGERIPNITSEGITYIQVENSAFSTGIIAGNFFNNPSGKIRLTGITGTNGKTTIATLLYNLTRRLGYNAGLISTVKNYINDSEIGSTNTTPDAISLNKLLSEMVIGNCDFCFMEVSSHAIDQDRIAGLDFSGGVFSNITHDHLDYHKTFESYIKAKKKFFDNLPESAFSLINIDDKNGKIMQQNTKSKIITYSLHSMSDFKCKIIESCFDGMLLNIDGREIWIKLIGRFNAYNVLAVYATATMLGLPREEVLLALSDLNSVEGRFQYVKSRTGIVAIIDYAHTPDALMNVINTINEIKPRHCKLITVVGAGGNRDKTKRPVMADIAVRLSDRLILTSDNPRFEKPEDILSDMKKGIDENLDKKYLTLADRKEAIKTACMLAEKGDIILIAGKGHENYQEINGIKYHFDDKEIVQEIFNNLN